MRKTLLSLCALFLLVPTIACAATFRSSDTNSVSLGTNEVIKNAYLAGNTVDVQGKVTEDMISAGNTITLSGTVLDNLTAAGNTLNINGHVGKSARLAGANITVSSAVGSDLLIAGGTVTLTSSSSIKDDLSIAAGTVNIGGSVGGNVYITGGDITINGVVGGDVIIKETSKVIIGDSARIKGKLDYGAQEKATISDKAVISGETIFTQVSGEKSIGNKIPGVTTALSLFILFATFIFLLLLINLLPKTLKSLVEKGFAKPYENIGIGFVYLVVTPIAALILLVTLIGLPIGIFVLGLYAVSMLIAKMLTPILIGSLAIKWIKKEKEYKLDWLTVLTGILLTTVIGLIPFVGWLLVFVVFLIILAVFVQSAHLRIRSER